MSVSGGSMSGQRARQDPVAATLALLQDTKKFEDHLKRLARAEEKLRKTASDSQAAVVKAREQAEKHRAEAAEKAQTLIKDAESQASSLRQAVQGEKATAEKAAKQKERDLQKWEARLASDEADYLKRKTAMDRREAAVTKKSADNQALKKILEQKANRLTAACNEVLA